MSWTTTTSPNLTIGTPMGSCEGASQTRVTAPYPIVHLMVYAVDDLIRECSSMPWCQLHPPSSESVRTTLTVPLQLIREVGCKAGLVFNPGHTTCTTSTHVMDKADMDPADDRFNPGSVDQS